MNSCGHDGSSYFYIDETNAAISNGPALCSPCYATRYGTKTMRMDDWSPTEWGVLGLHNLLSSGDFIHRNEARARFYVHPAPADVHLAGRTSSSIATDSDD